MTATIYDRMLHETVYTKCGEIALVTRIDQIRDYGTQVYGVFCTGPLTDSLNAAGEPNEFCLSISDEELAHFGIE